MSPELSGRPTLVLVTGPGGVGKTTLARRLADAIGCPVISRDAIKEGMAAATPGFRPAESDPLTVRTYDVFFDVLILLLDNGVSVVAEAAFQHANWVRRLDPLLRLADVRLIRCHAGVELRRERAARRGREVGARAAHDDAGYFAAHPRAGVADFDAVRLPAPTLDVDTTDGYRPDLAAILSFVEQR